MIIKMSEGNTTTVIRRNLPGTKAAKYSQWNEEAFEEMDSTLAVQQYIQQTIRSEPQGEGKSFLFLADFFYFFYFLADVETILTAPETQDEGVWKYEHLRQFCMELNGLAVKLQGEELQICK